MKKKIFGVSDDAQSVNFREIRVGAISPNTLYRSSHPIPGDRQESLIALLAAKYRIAAVINLSDSPFEVKRKAFFAPWYKRLFINNQIIALGMDFDIIGKSFNRKLKNALQFIIKTSGPWLIHCHAGIDRTGFVSMVLEALMGATIDDITHDYLLSFNSIFESSMFIHSNKADSMVVIQLLSTMDGSLSISDQTLQGMAEHYLKDKIGLSIEEIDLLRAKLSNGNFTGKPQGE
jgi:protein tyrosine/serine phosphatase